MKDRTQVWLQLFVAVVLPLLVGGGSFYLLVEFKEHLPVWLYTTFIFAICLVLIAIPIRLAFGDLLNKLRMWIEGRVRHRAALKAAKEWRHKWVELWQLIHEVTENDW